ncbi:MAG: hypothetical protein ACRC3H_00295, partial [Lachnospiraceae bacterium]
TVVQTGAAFYILLPGLISAIYVIITANKLIAAQVDRGTMAYILSTPVKREAVALTQGIFYVGSLFLMFGISAMTHVVFNYKSAGEMVWADIKMILLLNLGLFMLDLALSGICFLASGVFNLSKYAIAIGGGIVGAFHLLSMMALFSEDFHFLKNISLVTLYDTSSILEGSTDFVLKFIVLAVVGVVTYFVGIIAFTKRDLPL